MAGRTGATEGDATAESTHQLDRLERDMVNRTDAAIRRLEDQLSTVPEVIRGVCTEAVLLRVESASHLWADEVDDASRSLPLECEPKQLQPPD